MVTPVIVVVLYVSGYAIARDQDGIVWIDDASPPGTGFFIEPATPLYVFTPLMLLERRARNWWAK